MSVTDLQLGGLRDVDHDVADPEPPAVRRDGFELAP